MNDMSELERRMSAALDRIATHVAALQRPAPDAAPTAPSQQRDDDDLPHAATLMAELEAERAVSAQLQERVRAIKDRQDARVAALESDLAAAQDRILALEEQVEALRDGAVEDDTEALRAALADLQAEREAERAELAQILAELQPIIEESQGA